MPSNEKPGSAVGQLAAVNQRLVDLLAALAVACEASGSGWATLAQIIGQHEGLRDQAAAQRAIQDLEYLDAAGVTLSRVGEIAVEHRPRSRR